LVITLGPVQECSFFVATKLIITACLLFPIRIATKCWRAEANFHFRGPRLF